MTNETPTFRTRGLRALLAITAVLTLASVPTGQLAQTTADPSEGPAVVQAGLAPFSGSWATKIMCWSRITCKKIDRRNLA